MPPYRTAFTSLTTKTFNRAVASLTPQTAEKNTMYRNEFAEENQDDFDALYGDDSLTSTAPDKKKKSRRARSVAPSDSARSWANRTAPWQGNAKPLAEWTIKHLVNRTDVWGAYLPLDRRLGGRKATTKPSRATREIVLLTTQVLQTHFECQNVGDVVGLHSISVDGTCRWIAWDIDRHDDGKEAPSVESNLRRAIGIHDRLISLGMKPLLIESNGDDEAGLSIAAIHHSRRHRRCRRRDQCVVHIPQPALHEPLTAGVVGLMETLHRPTIGPWRVAA